MNVNRKARRKGNHARISSLEAQLANASKVLTQVVVVNTILMNRFNITQDDINREYTILINQNTKHDAGTEPVKADPIQPQDVPSNENNIGSTESGIPRGASDDINQASAATEVQSGVQPEDDRSDTTVDPS